MPTEQKAKAIHQLKDELGKAPAVYFVNYERLNAAQITKLRREFRDANSQFHVVKNTLTRIAAEQNEKGNLATYLKGPTAMIVCKNDMVKPAKILSDFAKANDTVKIKGGVVEGQIISADDVKKMADIPPREVLIAQLLGSMQSPVSGFVGTLSGVLRNMVTVLDAIAKEKEKKQSS